jgi:predicted ABC-type sugar transport system permease subunit
MRDVHSETRRRETRPLGELFSQLANDTTLLMRQEVALAKKELQQSLAQAAGGAVWLAVGAILATVGLIAVLTSVILALALIMPHWAAALLVGLVFLVLGALFAWSGVKRFSQLKLVPERTAQTLREDAEMIREKAR